VMKALRDIFRFFIYSNLFIACCAVLMLAQTGYLLQQTAPSFDLIVFVFSATISSYSFHWYLTPAVGHSDRISWLARYQKIHLYLFILGTTGAVIYGVLLISHWPWLVFAAFITFLYSAPKVPHPWFKLLRKIAIGKTIFLALVWMFVTTILPLEISNKPWQTDYTLFAIGRFFLIYSICILFDYRDKEYDISAGIRSLITWLDEKSINVIFLCSVAVFSLATLWMFRYGYSVTVIITLLIPGVITTLLYSYAKSSKSDMLYYFVLDGLMALSALLYGFTMI
jgi:4-hydroxybenzoate polyprenyltransferase